MHCPNRTSLQDNELMEAHSDVQSDVERKGFALALIVIAGNNDRAPWSIGRVHALAQLRGEGGSRVGIST